MAVTEPKLKRHRMNETQMSYRPLIRFSLAFIFYASLASCSESDLSAVANVLEKFAENEEKLEQGWNPKDLLKNADENQIQIPKSLLKSSKIDILPEYRDFDSSHLMGKLIQLAELNSTSLIEFQIELRELILHHQKQQFTGQQWPGDVLNVDARIRANETLDHLKRKYNISSSTNLDPETITLQRLSLMFPHYNDFELKNYYDNGVIPYHNGKFCGYSFSRVPYPMKFKEFGGLIPLKEEDGVLEYIRESLIEVHLLGLACWQNDGSREMVLLEQRVQKSLLSNQQRIRILEKFNILLKDGTINQVFFRKLLSPSAF